MNPIRALRSLFRRDRLDHEMADEMQAHIEEQTRRNIEAGMDADAARAAARRQFGGMAQIQETARDGRGLVWLEDTVRDFRYAVRSLAKSPGYAAVVVATLALGIGSATAISSLGRNVLFPQLPYPEADQLVTLQEALRDGLSSLVMHAERFEAYHKHATSFSGIAARRSEEMNLVVDGQPQPQSVLLVTPGYFSLLGIPPRTGHDFLALDVGTETEGTIAIISHEAWQKHFGADPSVIGQEIVLGDRHRRIIGILPPAFRSPPGWGESGFYLPLSPPQLSPSEPNEQQVSVVARLKPGVTIEAAEAELATIKPQLSARGAEHHLRLPIRVARLSENYKRIQHHQVWIFIGAVGFLYAIACVNAASMLLARTINRRRELHIRLALGGSRIRIVRLLLCESLLLSGFGGLFGSVLAYWGYDAMVGTLPWLIAVRESLPSLDAGFLLVSFGFSLLTGILVVLAPACRVSDLRVNETLKEGARSLGNSRQLDRLRSGLVVMQAAAAVVLLAAAGLLLQSLNRLQAVDLGFDLRHRFALFVTVPDKLERDVYLQRAEQISEQLMALPEVTAVALTSNVPIGGWPFAFELPVSIEGSSEAQRMKLAFYAVGSGYFDVLGQQLIAGRDFSRMRPGDRPVMVINRTLAGRMFGTANPIGQYLECKPYGRGEVIGIVNDTHDWSPRDAPNAQVFMPYWQLPNNPPSNLILQLATQPSASFERDVRKVLYAVDPGFVARLDSLEEKLGERLQVERYTRNVIQVMAVLALVLAAFGLFSVMAYAVAQRRAEFGLRLALGATPGDLSRLVVRRGVILAAIGIVVGLVGAAGFARFLQNLLYETSPLEPVVFIAVALLLLVVAGLACWLPARRAAKVDPVIALRAG